MHLSRFNLNLLVALDALLQEKNVTRAAERVFVSQPTMSLALGKLRDYFNDPLLVRVGREHELTARGLALVEPVRETLLRAQAVLGTQSVFDAATARRTFRIMMPDFVGPALLPRVLAKLVDWAPGIHIQLENWSAGGAARVVSGEVDLLLASDNAEALGLEKFPEGLCRAYVQTQRWVCAVARDHPVVQGELTREQFFGLPHVSVRVPGAVDGLTMVRKQRGVELDVRLVTQNALQIPFLVQGTPLIAILPEGLARQLAGSLAIRVVEIPEGLVPATRIELFWHRRNEPDAGHTWMRSLLLETATQR